MKSEFPKNESTFVKSALFIEKTPVVFNGYDQVAPEEKKKNGKVVQTMEEAMKYNLGYSYPEYQINKTTFQPVLDEKSGKQKRNSNYDPNHPNGYSICYHFDIGDFSSGSLRLYYAWSNIRPKIGEHFLMWKVGEGFDTNWFVERAGQKSFSLNDGLPDFDVDRPLGNPEQEIPF